MLLSGKDIPGVGNSMSGGTDIGMSRADTGTGLEMKKLLSSCDAWQAWVPPAAQTLPAAVDPVLGACECAVLHFVGLEPAASPLNLIDLNKQTKKAANYCQVWFSFSLEYSQLPSGSAANF